MQAQVRWNMQNSFIFAYVKAAVHQVVFSTVSDIITFSITPVTGCSAWLQCPLGLSGPKHHSKTSLPYLLTNQMMSQAD